MAQQAADADDPPFTLTISSEEPYSFRDGFSSAQITDEDIENSATLTAKFGILESSFSYLTSPEGDGEQIGASLAKEKCPVLPALGCSASISFRHLPGETTRTYEAGIDHTLEIWGVKPKLSVTASHEATDEISDSIITAGIQVPFKMFGFMTLKLNTGLAHNFEENETEPLLGATLKFDLPNRFALELGYESRVERVEEERFEVNGKFAASLSVGF